jgi:DNA-binding NarL/FixJ family response regulator
VKVVIAEDLQPMRQHAVQLLNSLFTDPLDCYETQSGVEALELDRVHDPDLVILDISMPDLSGIKVAEKIWARSPRRKILFWSQYSREAHVRELGKIVPDEAIHGYVLKSESDEIFLHALRSIVTLDNPYISAQIRGIGTKIMSKDSSMTDVEYATLMDLVMGLTDKAIARRHQISVRGTQNRISILFNKLLKGEDSYYQELAGMEIFSPRTRAAYIAFQRGLLDPDSMQAMEQELKKWLAQEFE